MKLTYTIDFVESKKSISKFLSSYYKLPNSLIEKCLRSKDVKVNGKVVSDRSYILEANDIIEIYGVNAKIESRNKDALFSSPQFDIVYEDENILIVNKPAWCVMHGEINSLDNQVLTYLNYESRNSFIPASIGRIDRVTSGIVVYAKNHIALKSLNEHINDFEKIYLLKSDLPKAIDVSFKIGHDEKLQREVVCNYGKVSKTNFYFDGKDLLAKILTGRKHQIRASLAHLGYPIYGDLKYGGKKGSRVFLHAYKLKFLSLPAPLEYLNGQEFITKKPWQVS